MNIDNEVLKRKDLLIKDLQEWIKKSSVYDEKSISKDAPFGKGVKGSLDYIASLAKKDGFKVDKCNGYCTEISYGEGKDIIMILGHGDVVPEGKGWKFDPYKGIIDNNLMYGRGTLDDKGPTMCSYYALKILKDNNIIPNKIIKLVVGGNEENGSKCLEYYFHKLKRPAPTYGFTPDADFPLIYGEKGILTYEYYGSISDDVIQEIEAGLVSNAVIGESKIILRGYVSIPNEFLSFLEKKDVKCKVEYIGEDTTLKLIGLAAHAAEPEKGINSLAIGLEAIGKFFNSKLAKHFGEIFKSYYGNNIGLKHKSSPMGKLTMNLGIGRYKDRNYSFIINIRYPNSINSRKIVDILNKHRLNKGKLLYNSDPLYINPKTKYIKTLLNAYKSVTNDKKAKPITIGGGTYARETVNTVAFGMDFKRNNGSGNIHTVDEAINLDDLVDGTKIYTKALLDLLEL